MNNSTYKELKAQLSSFADDEDSVYFEPSGYCTLERNGDVIGFTLKEKDDIICVDYDDKEYKYEEFLSNVLAQLKLFAGKIKHKYSQEEFKYVDPEANLFYNTAAPKSGKSLELLHEECSQSLLNGTKMCFVTADAGHGKTMLLKQYMIEQAERFLNGKSKYIFWHIDLHGRELVRLNEAIMSELGELRMRGIYYETVITLIKNGLIVLGIDGFDELAVEVGGENALSSLNDLVSKMDGEGTLVAASRRAFFNTQDYIKRSKLIKNSVSANCEIHEIKLFNWREKQCVEYMEDYAFDNPKEIYSNMLSILGCENHPLLERPYLFTKICQYAFDENVSPNSFLENKDGLVLNGVDQVIEEFVKREVSKWKERDKETGKPYLTYEQHIQLLAEVAKEMWDAQKEFISIETIHFILTLLFDEWKIEDKIRPMVITMSGSHAFLLPVASNDKLRRFDHEEFRNYFIAKALYQIMTNDINKGNFSDTEHFLKKGSLPLSVSQYVANVFDCDTAKRLICGLQTIHNEEWKPTYIQPNIGNMMPFLLDRINDEAGEIVMNGLSFQSIVFEHKTIRNVKFSNCSFYNISLANTVLEKVVFDNCEFAGIVINPQSDCCFDETTIYQNCQIKSVTIRTGDGEISTEYAPYCIQKVLNDSGIAFESSITGKKDNSFEIRNTQFRKVVHRFLNKFNNSAYQYEKNLDEDPIFNARKSSLVLKEVIPLFVKFNLIEERETGHSRQMGSRAWSLKQYDVEDIKKAEEQPESPLYEFWRIVNEHE